MNSKIKNKTKPSIYKNSMCLEEMVEETQGKHQQAMAS